VFSNFLLLRALSMIAIPFSNTCLTPLTPSNISFPLSFFPIKITSLSSRYFTGCTGSLGPSKRSRVPPTPASPAPSFYAFSPGTLFGFPLEFPGTPGRSLSPGKGLACSPLSSPSRFLFGASTGSGLIYSLLNSFGSSFLIHWLTCLESSVAS